MKRTLSTLLCLVLLLCFASSALAQDQNYTKLVLYQRTAGNMGDAGLVAEEINKYIRPLIGAEIELHFINAGSYFEQVSLMVQSGEQIDLMFADEARLRTYVRQDALLELDDLLAEYGDGIMQYAGDFIEAERINGYIYGVPSMKDMATSKMYIYNKALAEEAGADFSNVKTLEDLTAVFAVVKEKFPDLYMYAGTGSGAVNYNQWDWDALSDSFGVLMDSGMSTEVVNLFATQEYMDICAVMREWYLAGYIERDFVTSTQTRNSRMMAGTCLGGITSYKPGALEENENSLGFELGYVILTEAFSATSSILNANWVIPASTVDAEKAMQFLNLMYSDAYLENLLLNGIEDVHYATNEDGTISFIDYESHQYQSTIAWSFGNQFITKVWAPNALDIYERTMEWNLAAAKSEALGFTYDSTSVANELTACSNVLNKYRASLESGAVDPQEVLPQLNAELESAGLSTIIEAKQQQLDAFLGQ